MGFASTTVLPPSSDLIIRAPSFNVRYCCAVNTTVSEPVPVVIATSSPPETVI